MTKSFHEAIVGAWKLVEYTMEDSDGKKFYPLGKNAKGFILFTPDGYMSAQIMAVGRPAYASGDLHTGTKMAKVTNGYLAYSGRYEVKEASRILVHHMDVSLNPAWLNQSQDRFVKFIDDKMIITASINTDVLIWKRAAAEDEEEKRNGY